MVSECVTGAAEFAVAVVVAVELPIAIAVVVEDSLQLSLSSQERLSTLITPGDVPHARFDRPRTRQKGYHSGGPNTVFYLVLVGLGFFF